jgi:hypothetical protein
MPATTRRKFTPMLLVFRNFNSHLVVCRLAGHQEKGGRVLSVQKVALSLRQWLGIRLADPRFLDRRDLVGTAVQPIRHIDKRGARDETQKSWSLGRDRCAIGR